MKKKKRRTPLPRGFGSIRQLPGKRRNPYAVYPPVTEWTESGSPVTPKAIAYVSTWQKGFVILQAYHAGTYTPDMITMLDIPALEVDDPQLQAVIDRMLNDYRIIHNLPTVQKTPTLAEIYAQWHAWKYEQDKSRTYSAPHLNVIKSGFAHLSPLHNVPIGDITRQMWQDTLDAIPLSGKTVAGILSLVHQLSAYAIMEHIIEHDETVNLRVTQAGSNELKAAVPFDLVRKMWDDRDDPIVAVILMLCYTGLRINESKSCKVDPERQLITGGSKTEAGKNRQVPIHPAIRDLIGDRTEGLYDRPMNTVRQYISAKFALYGHPELSAHSCRRTFENLCEKAKISVADTKRLMGHANQDITTGVYGRRDIEDIRQEMLRIPSPWDL